MGTHDCLQNTRGDVPLSRIIAFPEAVLNCQNWEETALVIGCIKQHHLHHLLSFLDSTMSDLTLIDSLC